MFNHLSHMICIFKERGVILYATNLKLATVLKVKHESNSVI